MSNIFRDDSTGQLSLGRICTAVILVYLFYCTLFLLITKDVLTDVPSNWLYAMLAFYGINKTSSTIKEVKGVSGTVMGA